MGPARRGSPAGRRWPVLLLLAVAAGAPAQPGPPDNGTEPPPHGGGHGGGGLFVSPMGEPFRGPDAMGQWFRGADRDGNGRLVPAECTADAARFFATLDVNGDGEIDPEELTRYETEIAPEVQSGAGGGGFDRGQGGGGRHGGGHGGSGGGGRHGGGGMGGGGGGMGGGMGDGRGDPGGASGPGGGASPERPQGAARFGLLDLPEPVIAADTDFNRGVSRAEFHDAAVRRCHLLDRDGDGAVAWAELPARTPSASARARGKRPPTR